MAINILFDLYLTNEYGVEAKVTDNVGLYKEIKAVGMIYNVCEFVLASYTLPTTLSQDGVARIRVERVIDGVSFSDSYIIDDMVMQDNNKLKIIGKTVGALLFEPYMLPQTKTFNYDTYNDLFSELLGTTPKNILLGPIENKTAFYEIVNTTYGSAIVALAEKLGIDIYVKNGDVVLEEMKRILASDVPLVTIRQADVISASITNKKSGGIGKVSINTRNAELVSTASMALDVSAYPQPISPLIPRSWIDPQTGDTYLINPEDAKLTLYYNPINAGEPTITGYGFTKVENFFTVEEFNVIDESALVLKGGILSIAGITLSDGTETASIGYPTAIYDATPQGENLVFTGVTDGLDLSTGNGVKITVKESGANQAISSTISGAGTDADPYIYDIFLGNVENIFAQAAIADIDIVSMYTFSSATEKIQLTAKNKDATLNGHVIKIDATGAVQTSGYLYSPSETIFYLDPTKVYGSVAKAIYYEITNSLTLPYTAKTTLTYVGFELTPKKEVQTCGTFAGGVTEAYAGQRDNKAISEFVAADPNASGVVTVSASLDTENPVTLPGTIITAGGYGNAFATSQAENFSFERYHNVLYFNENVTGTLRVAYNTTVYTATVPPSEKAMNIPMKFTHLDALIKFSHEIRAVGYFPITYNYQIDVADTWSIPYSETVYAPISIKSVNNYTGLETPITTVYADATGLLNVRLGVFGYGQYSINALGKPPLYIRYYANKYDASFDKIIIKEAPLPTDCGG